MAAVIYPDVNSLWDALTADWGQAGSYGLLLEDYLTASVLVVTTALGAEFDGTPDLYDVLVTGGIPAWAAAAAPANNISMAQVIRQIYDDLVVVDGIVDTIVGRTQYNEMKDAWFSGVDDVVALTQAASDDALPGVVLPIMAGRTIDRVHVGLSIGHIINTDAGANGMTGAQELRIKTTGGAWGADDVVGIDLIDNTLMTPGDGSRGGLVFIGALDVSGEVNIFNETYVMRLEDCTVDNDFLNLYDVQTFLVVVYY